MSNCWRCRSAANTTKEEKGRKKIRGYNLAIKKNKLIIYKHNLNEFPEKAKGQSYKVSLVQYNFIDIRFKVIEMQINGSLQRVTEDKRSWVNIMVPYSDRSVLILTLSRFIFCYYKCNSSVPSFPLCTVFSGWSLLLLHSNHQVPCLSKHSAS